MSGGGEPGAIQDAQGRRADAWGVPIAEIAERVGYESNISFARAFKRVTSGRPVLSKELSGDNPDKNNGVRSRLLIFGNTPRCSLREGQSGHELVSMSSGGLRFYPIQCSRGVLGKPELSEMLDRAVITANGKAVR